MSSKNLKQITTYDIERLMTSLKGELKPQTIKHILQLINRIFNLAAKWGMFEGENPVAKVEKPKVNNGVVQYLTLPEVKRLLEVCAEYPDRDAADIVRFALYTGLRKSSIFRLRWQDIDFDNNILYLRESKSGKPLAVPLNHLAVEVLKNRPRTAEYVFPGLNGEQRKVFKKPWAKIKALAGIPPDFRFHSLRHAFASLLVSNGVGLYEVAKLLGHADLKMSQRYSHFLPGRLQKASETLAKVIDFKNRQKN